METIENPIEEPVGEEATTDAVDAVDLESQGGAEIPEADDATSTPLEALPPRPRIIGPVEMKTLKNDLSADRREVLSNELVEIVLERDERDREKKSYDSRLNAEIKDLDTRASKLATTLDDGYEEGPVRCVWMLDYTNSIAELVRTDNHEVLERRSLTPQEKQQKMALDEDRHPDDQEGLFDEPLPEAPALSDDALLVDKLVREVRGELGDNPHGLKMISLSTAFSNAYQLALTQTENRPAYWPAKWAPEHLFRVPVIEMADQVEPYILVTNDAAEEAGELTDADLTPMSEEEKQATLDAAAAGTWADRAEEVASDD